MEMEPLDILLIEDNDGDVHLVRTFLKSSFSGPHTLRSTDTLAKGHVEIGDKRPDILLLDLNLPDSQGSESLEFLSKYHRRFPIIIMSGHNQPELRLKAIKLGAQDYIVKGEYSGRLLERAIHYSMERHAMQRKLRNFAKELNDKRLKLIEAQAIAQLGHWEFDAFHQVFYWSTQACQILDMINSKMPLREFLDMVSPNDRNMLKEVFRQAIEEHSEFNIDVALVLQDKSSRFLNLRVKSNHAAELDKKLIVGTMQDISARKKIEDDLKASEEKYHNLFDESRDAIYITTAEGNFIEFNKATLELFGYNRVEIASLNVKDLYLDPFERVKFRKEVEEKGFVRDFEVKLRRKDSTKIDCLITSTLWKSNDGSQTGYQGVIRDITEKRRSEDLLKEKEVAERSGKLKERFLANMSHEIRTPINAISGLTHLLLQSELNGKQLEYINGIRSSAEHLLELVNDILDFSKIEEGKVEFESIPFDLYEVVKQSVETLRFRAADKKLELKLEIEPEVPKMLKGDPVRLKQILINLITNAVKFTDEGYVLVAVKLVEKGNQDFTVSFTVQDTGVGIPEDKQETIFSSFTQLGYDVNKPEGTGLGLTITRQLVELQGGAISLKSKEGEGSTFKVVLKYKMADGSAASLKTNALDFRVEDIGAKRILIVEDKPLNQLVAKEMLKRWWPNLQIDIADNGRIGVEKLGERLFDLVLMDVQMPEMDGYEATRYVRSRLPEPFKSVPILAMTAYATTGEAEKCIEAGMDDYISKPFEPKQLYDKIMMLVEGKTSQPVLKQIVGNNPPQQQFEQLDLSYLDMVAGGNESLRSQIIDLLLLETPDEMEKLRNFMLESNWPRVRGIAHKMKSTATYMGLKETLANLKMIEEYANQQVNTEKIPEMVKLVELILQPAIEQLKVKR